MTVTKDKELIRQTFIRLPVNEQFALLQDLLQVLAPTSTVRGKSQGTFSKALGLLATDQFAPTDSEVHKTLREHRLEKYG